MHRTALIARLDSNVLKGLVPAFAISGVQGEPGSRIEVHPVQDAFDTHPHFIRMVYRADQQQAFDAFDAWLQRLSRLSDPTDQGACGKLTPAQISQGFAGALQGEPLKLGERPRRRGSAGHTVQEPRPLSAMMPASRGGNGGSPWFIGNVPPPPNAKEGDRELDDAPP